MKKQEKLTIYHNNSCSKSCYALSVLQEAGVAFELIEYLNDTPGVEELRDIIGKLKCNPQDIVRKTEPLYLEKYKDKQLRDEEWIRVLHENPILIQRPIIIKGGQAVVARTPEVIPAGWLVG